MPFQAFALLMLLPALIACSTTGDVMTAYGKTDDSHQQPLLLALHDWSPALGTIATGPVQVTTDNPATILNPAQAQAFALQHSPAIRSILASQGIADADYRQATLINNPGFSASALRAEGSWKTEFGISLGILDWLTQPMRKRLANAELEAARTGALTALTRELGAVRSRYFAAVAARHASRQQQQTAEAARLNAELARQLNQAGNLSELEQLRYEDELARQQLAAQQAITDADIRLAELELALGLPFNSELVVPDALPDTDADLLTPAALRAILQNADTFAALLTTAMQQRPEVTMMRNTRVSLEHRLDLQQKQFGMSELGLGLVTEREPDGSNASGLELDLSLPLFDRGQHRVSSIQSRLAQLTADEQALQLAIAHQLSRNLNNLLNLSQQVRQLRDQDIPRQQRMLELVLQEYNFMLSGPFELISVKQQETETVMRYVSLLERYWAEHADFMQHSANTADTFVAGLVPTSDPSALSPDSSSPHSPAPHSLDSESSNHQEHHHD